MEYTLGLQQEFLSPRTHICWEAPVVHNLALSLLFPSVSYTFLLCDLASLLSIFSFFPLVLKQAVYCVCSAEQPALKAVYMCVSVFVPASLSDHVNPLRGPAHLLPALPPFFFPLLAFIGLHGPLSHLICSPTCQSQPTRIHKGQSHVR